jgi:hypothetical protein
MLKFEDETTAFLETSQKILEVRTHAIKEAAQLRETSR